MVLPTGDKISVAVISSIFLLAELELYDVLYIPSFKFNLLSKSSLLKSKAYNIMFSHNSFFIQDIKSLRKIGKGELHEGLYVFHPILPPSSLGLIVFLHIPIVILSLIMFLTLFGIIGLAIYFQDVLMY